MKTCCNGRRWIFFQWNKRLFGRAVLWTRLCAVPVYPHGGIGNCAAEQPLWFAEELVNASFVVKSGSAELAETGKVPTRLSQIKIKCTYSSIFTIQIYFSLRVHLYFHHQTHLLWSSLITNAEWKPAVSTINWRWGTVTAFLLDWCNLELALEKGVESWTKTLP